MGDSLASDEVAFAPLVHRARAFAGVLGAEQARLLFGLVLGRRAYAVAEAAAQRAVDGPDRQRRSARDLRRDLHGAGAQLLLRDTDVREAELHRLLAVEA